MKPEVYRRHIENFSNHWGFRARKNIIEESIKNFIKKKKLKILDFGSGSGVNIKMLSSFGTVTIYEPENNTFGYLKRKYKNSKSVKFAKILGNKKFDLIVAADVIEHIKNDKQIVTKLSKNLNKNGFVLATVPAFNFLFSKKDLDLHHYRRYSIKEFKNLFKKFDIIKLSYFNFILFLPIAITILILKLVKINFIEEVENKPLNLFNNLFYLLFNLEKKILKYFDLPFGISIIGIFKKN